VTPLFIPSPEQGVWHLGPVPIRAYALCVIAGMALAWFTTRARWRARGGDVEHLEVVMFAAIAAGLVGARLYYVLIEWPRFFGPGGVWYHVFYVWQGGLGIWGGITVGVLTAFVAARRLKLDFAVLADCAAPALPLAQAVGRFGNWWNQELYGRPTTLPWALEIDPRHRVAGYQAYATFHPTFLYEVLWNLAVAAVLVFVGERRFKLGRGKLFAAYIVCYAAGRLTVESFRIDPVSVYGGWRINSWVTLGLGLAGLAALLWLWRRRPGSNGPDAAASAEPAPEPADDALDPSEEPVDRAEAPAAAAGNGKVVPAAPPDGAAPSEGGTADGETG
jgi:prolipoprotein diacylglyceryl transferase